MRPTARRQPGPSPRASRRTPRSHVPGGLGVPPRVQAPVSTARRLLPLRLGLQSAAGPLAERRGVVPVDVRDRMRLESVGNAATRPVGRCRVARRADERGELVVRDGGGRELDRVDVDRRLRRLVGADRPRRGAGVVPHDGDARRDLEQVDAGHLEVRCAGQPQTDVVVDRTGEQPVARGAPNVTRSVDERPAANDARAVAVALASVLPRVRVRAVEARRPLPRVAREIEMPERASALRPSPDRRRVLVASTAWADVGGASPHGHVRASSPRAARSHCASVGSAPPAQRQYADASSQVT